MFNFFHCKIFYGMSNINDIISALAPNILFVFDFFLCHVNKMGKKMIFIFDKAKCKSWIRNELVNLQEKLILLKCCPPLLSFLLRLYRLTTGCSTAQS